MKFLLSIVLFAVPMALSEGKAAETPTPGAPEGTYTCRSEIKYSWQPGVQGSVDAPGTPPPSDAKPIEVSYGVVEAKSKTEAETKAAIAQRIMQEKTTASNRCRHAHENLAGCISTKYASMSSILNALSFTARSELEKAINEDCTKQSGRCLSASSSEPECSFQAMPTPTPDPAAAAAADKGKKKK